MNMDFYFLEYRYLYLKDGEWVPYDNDFNQIIVVASNIEEAKDKIEKCFEVFRSGDKKRNIKKVEIATKVKKMEGLRNSPLFNGGMYCFPICDK